MQIYCLGWLVMILATAATAAAQPALHPVYGGYIHDAGTRSLRAIVGLPGGAYLGKPVAQDIDSAWPAPGNHAALVIRGGQTALLTGLSLQNATTHEDGLLASPTLVAWDSSGHAAAVYSPVLNAIQRIRVYEGSVEIEPALTLGGMASVRCIAVNRAGDVALSGEGGTFIMRNGAAAVRAVEAEASSLDFAGSASLYAASSGAVLEISLDDLSVRSLNTARPISALAVLAKQGRLWAIDQQAREAVVFDFAGRELATVALERAPSMLQPLDRDSTFLLSAGGSSLLVLSDGGTPGVFFVPIEEAGAR